MNLTIIRHGRTEDNEKRILQGQSRNKGLSEEGRDDIESLIENNNVNFDLVYSSDLLRATETAEYFVNNKNEIIVSSYLRERNYGIYEGTDLDAFLKKYKDVNVYSKPQRGESIIELRDRIISFFESINFHELSNKDVLLVTHMAIYNNLIHIAEGKSYFELSRIKMPQNGEFYKIETISSL